MGQKARTVRATTCCVQQEVGHEKEGRQGFPRSECSRTARRGPVGSLSNVIPRKLVGISCYAANREHMKNRYEGRPHRA